MLGNMSTENLSWYVMLCNSDRAEGITPCSRNNLPLDSVSTTLLAALWDVQAGNKANDVDEHRF